MKSRLQLSEILLMEISSQCSVDPSRDLHRLRRRVVQEGDSFLTITLPAFCQSFERSLARGFIDQGDFLGFARVGRQGPPRFLSGFLSMVFDAAGVLRREVPSDVVFVVRQFCLLHKKSWAIANEERQAQAILGYLRAEDEITEDFEDPGSYFSRVAEVVLRDVLNSGSDSFDPEDIVGVHGPGATAEGYTTNQKWHFGVWHDRLEQLFSYSRHGTANYGLAAEKEVQDRVSFVPENEERPVKVVFVPKTMKTPRVIAIEPSCMQYIQQGLMRFLVPLVEGGSRLTAGRVNFTDQKVNQRLALRSSSDGRLATLDMKEASDRVSYAHAKALFAAHPELWACIDASRSRVALLPNGKIVALRKFASMGSALCFPVEALAFYCAIVASRLRSRFAPVTHASIHRMSRDVYVYGDDLIVPTDEAESIGQDLASFGFKVNTHKSFWTGKFRESCGVDAYDGVNVTPTYCRFAPPDRTESEALVSWVAMANGFYTNGLWRTARAVREHVENVLGALPASAEEMGGLHWKTYSRSYSVGRWNGRTHSFEVRTWVPSPVRRDDLIDSLAALHKCLSSMYLKTKDALTDAWASAGNIRQHLRDRLSYLDPTPSDDKHLLTTVRRHALALKRGWVPAR